MIELNPTPLKSVHTEGESDFRGGATACEVKVKTQVDTNLHCVMQLEAEMSQ